jgi:hypothetical protein
MQRQTYVFNAELVGFEGVRRTVTVREDLTLVDLHYALQSAFGWDDEHLYSFWLDGSFWGPEDGHYMHPYHAASLDPPGKSACMHLDELGLEQGQQIAYVFDFAREWRVALELREIAAARSGVGARCIESVGEPPPRDDTITFESEVAASQATIEFIALMVEEADAA